MRIIKGSALLKVAIQAEIKDSKNLMIVGSVGSAKTETVDQAIKELGYNRLYFSGVTSDIIDIKGMPKDRPEGGISFEPIGVIREMLESTERTVFIMDDFGQALVSLMAGMMQLTNATGRLDEFRVPDCVSFIVMTNRVEDNSGVRPILDAFKSRFTIVQYQPSAEDWIRYGITQGYPDSWLAFASFRPIVIEGWAPTSEIANVSNSRNMSEAIEIYERYSPMIGVVEGVTSDFLTTMLYGRIGDYATEFMHFKDVYQSLPSLNEILNDYNTAKLIGEDNPSARCAIMYSLASKASVTNIDSLFGYMQRLGNVFACSFMQLAKDYDSNIVSTTAWTSFVVANPHLFINKLNN